MVRRCGVAFLLLLLPIHATFAANPAAAQPTAKKTTWIATIIRNSKSGVLAHMSFSDARIPVTLMPTKDKLRPLVEIHEHYIRPGWELFAQNTSLLGRQPESKTEFKIFAYLNSRFTEITFIARGPTGETESEQILISAPDVQEFHMSQPWGELMVALGTSSFNFYQQGYGQFSSRTALLSLAYTTPRWNSRFGLYANAKMTMLTLSSTTPGGYGPQILEGKLDATYLLTKDPFNRLQTSAVLGISYLTMLSNGSPFGFANLMAAEAGARATYALGQVSPLSTPASSINGEVRWQPLGGVFDFDERGLDFSLAWSRKLANLHRIELGLGLSDFSYLATKGLLIKTTLFSVGLGYSI